MDAHISEFETNRRDFLKTLAVGAGGYTLGSLLIQPGEALGQTAQGSLDRIPAEARWEIASFGLVFQQVSFLKTLLDKEGREKFEEMVKKSATAAGGRGKGFSDRFGLTGTDAKSAAEIVPAVISALYGPTQKYELIESTPQKARIRCLNCAFWNNVQARKITDNICSMQSHAYWAGFCQAINPKLGSELVQARPRGNPTCEWVITLKS